MKSFELSPATTKVRVQFDFYQIDTWDGNTFLGPDKFKVFVNNNLVDLGFFTKETTDNRASGSTPVDGGIRWRREYIDSSRSRIFGTTVDERHHITIDIPENQLAPSGILTLQFFADVNEGNGNEPAGIDNLVIVSCPNNTPFPE